MGPYFVAHAENDNLKELIVLFTSVYHIPQPNPNYFVNCSMLIWLEALI